MTDDRADQPAERAEMFEVYRPLSEIEVRQAISHELAEAGYDIDADQVGWIVREYQVRLAAAFGRACILTGQVQR